MDEAEEEDHEEAVGSDFLGDDVFDRDVEDGGGDECLDPLHGLRSGGGDGLADDEGEGGGVADGEDDGLGEEGFPGEGEADEGEDEEDVIPAFRDDVAVAVVEEAEEGVGSGGWGMGEVDEGE